LKTFTETTLPNLFLNRVYRFGIKPFIYYKAEGQWHNHTWEDLGEKVERIGRGLLALGIKKDSKVCIISENRPEWMFFDLAILSIGGVTVPIYPTSTPEQLAHIIDHSEAEAVIVSTQALLKDAQKNASSKKRLWICLEESGDNQAISLNDVMHECKKVDVFTFYQILSRVQPEDLATIVYTSGTTGDPKGVMLTHDNIVSNTIASARAISIAETDHSLSFLPMSHMFERMAGFFCFMYFGACIHIAESIQTIPENLLEVKPTILISVPRVLEKFYNKVFENIESKSKFTQKLFHHALKTDNSLFIALYEAIFFKKIRAKMGGQIKFVVTGGAALTPTIATFFQRVGIPVLQGYGLTETSPVISVNRLASNKIGTVGEVLDNLEVKLSDDEEILVKGPSIMKGYYKNEKATQEVMTADGFFKTGDVGDFQNGILKITDRKKEIIVTSGGKKIAPQPIENELARFPIIDQVCLVGEGMKTIGALIVPNPNYIHKMAAQFQMGEKDYSKILQREEIQREIQKKVDEVNHHLSTYQQIKKFVLIPEPFSLENHQLTPTLKPRRKIIFEYYQQAISSMFANDHHQ
jgi:long-chain acyl-CoA synthetase